MRYTYTLRFPLRVEINKYQLTTRSNAESVTTLKSEKRQRHPVVPTQRANYVPIYTNQNSCLHHDGFDQNVRGYDKTIPDDEIGTR